MSGILLNMKDIILTDIHQDFNWVSNVLKAEKFEKGKDRLTLNGDITDTRNPEVSHNFIDAIGEAHKYAAFADILLGNHDAGYCEQFYQKRYIEKNPGNRFQFRLACKSPAHENHTYFENMMKMLNTSPKAIFKTGHRIIPFGNTNFLLTHAGVHDFFCNFKSKDYYSEISASLALRYDELFFENFMQPNALFTPIGRCRNGDSPYGGAIWRDAFEERTKAPLNQIYGHSPAAVNTFVLHRELDNNGNLQWGVNIDGKQTIYAVFENNVLFIRSVDILARNIPFEVMDCHENSLTEAKKEVRIYPTGKFEIE